MTQWLRASSTEARTALTGDGCSPGMAPKRAKRATGKRDDAGPPQRREDILGLDEDDPNYVRSVFPDAQKNVLIGEVPTDA